MTVVVAPPGASRSRAALGSALPPLVAALVLLGLWEGLVVAFDVQRFLLPRPSAIAAALVESFSVIGPAALFTLRSVLGGLVVGTAAGVAVAVATARFARATEVALPLAAALNSTPIVALAPIANNWFGITSPASKIAVVAAIVFFPVMINVTKGLTQVERGHLELMASYAASPGRVTRAVRAPNALPYLFAALKVAASLAVIAAIVTEYFGGPREALGVYIAQQAGLFRFTEAWAAIVAAAAIGLGLYALVLLAERLATPWQRPASR